MSELSPPSGNRLDVEYPPPPPPSNNGAPLSSSSSSVGRRGRSPGRDRSLSPRRRSPSGGRYYEDRRSFREDRPQRERYDYPRRDYYHRDYDHRDRYDRYDHRYDHRDRYERYDRGRYPPKSRKRPVDRGTDQDRKSSTTIYAGNLPYDFIERDVATMFERYGRLKSITVPLDTVTNKNKGFAFVEFEDRQDAEDAFEKFDGFSVEGRRLRLDWDIGLSKKEQHRPPRRSQPPPLDDHRDRGMSDPYAPPPPPPPMESRGYRRDSPEPYRR
ncbi:hypothetical protein G6F57_003114 [Rhizopus arrhizus]|uniref:RRM domain-containing protein n=1 Tax=Rhizopus oryzae TaxID=64495 RepID=A0A9P6XF06_RHIOR|nr:hypothetical protein G6F23_001532 [Rhizopus arrhizus]KAG1419292.1 hypothetical protein G6F58_004682 [Rhizopus delemar]KAG0763665.1 hypothetical protein G6F24_005836 [Rhizopus arrhizus]KAG0793672.1 hypothetical protein G6F21_003442 [Rhizopus arrhizus]KAG0799000.1 hypothetical protein G6F22_003662 [Rhizopus arrhizus]